MNDLTIRKQLEKRLAQFQRNLFTDEINIEECLKNINENTLKILYLYSLSESDRVFEDLLCVIDFIRNGREDIENIIKNPVFERVFFTANKVRREIHRFKGFLRFREIEGGYLYASFSPDYNIILPLARHFSNRMKNERIILHDRKRNLAVFCYKGRIYSAEINGRIPFETSIEKFISKLWVEYFEKIAIKERTNIKLQKQKVPVKYRKFITEFKGDS